MKIKKNNFAEGYFNGSLGVVTDLHNDSITVKLNDSGEKVLVGRVKDAEQKERYFCQESQKFKKRSRGYIEQIPMVLAWSLTTHSIQGQTINDVYIDLSDEPKLPPSMTYVFLSRCPTAEGITLAHDLTLDMVKIDDEILRWVEYFDNKDAVKLGI